MNVTLLGMGCGTEALTIEARNALIQAGLIVGAQRLLDALPEDCSGKRVAAVASADIVNCIVKENCKEVCIVFSGDSGFYSGARGVLPRLSGHTIRMLPGISCVQALAAALSRPWQNWRLASAHGTFCDPVAELMQRAPVLFLTGGPDGPATLCRAIDEAGLGELSVTVGEDLGFPTQKLTFGTAREFSSQKFSPLNVLLAEAVPMPPRRAPGWPDAWFRQEERVPLTKCEVRAAVLSNLAVNPEMVCWDIGAGTGSVGIEMAALCREVWAVEQSAEALALLHRNRKNLHAYNLHIIEGTAPNVLSKLPAPNAVFIGGSGGHMEEILQAVYAANSSAKVCVSAIRFSTLYTAYETMRRLGYEVSVTQLCINHSHDLGGEPMLRAQNPIFLILGEREGTVCDN